MTLWSSILAGAAAGVAHEAKEALGLSADEWRTLAAAAADTGQDLLTITGSGSFEATLATAQGSKEPTIRRAAWIRLAAMSIAMARST